MHHRREITLLECLSDLAAQAKACIFSGLKGMLDLGKASRLELGRPKTDLSVG
jgi:hypothetical protein